MKTKNSKRITAKRLFRLLEIAASAQEDLAATYRGMNWTAAEICAEIEAGHLRKMAYDFKTSSATGGAKTNERKNEPE